MGLGNIFVISAPSGCGKSSLVQSLCKLDEKIKTSISHTTRAIRPNEEHGIHYFFVSHNEFEKLIKSGEFLEHAVVYENYYGTHTKTIKELQEKGDDIILEIDHQGARQVKSIFNDATLIYILPPNLTELKRRLIKRNTDSKSTINNRLKLALDDISHADKFDYVLINDNFDVALQELYSIILVQRLKASRVLSNYKP